MSFQGFSPPTPPNASQQNSLFLRKWSITVSSAGGAGLDLSEMHMQFQVKQSDVQTPNAAYIRIYNLSDATAQQLIGKEYDRVVLQAGYQNGPYGQIFFGDIKQTKKGRLNPVDTYVDIIGADSDEGYNFGVINQTLAAGATYEDQINALAKAMGVQVGHLPDFRTIGDPQLIRGKVMYGLAKDYMRQIAQSVNGRWSLQNGKLILIPNAGYIESDPIVLSSQSGMIGLPEQTQSGIQIMALLNPKLVIGQSVKIDNASIQSASIQPGFGGPFETQAPGNLNLLPSKAADGLYRIAVAEYTGDTRGNDWYSIMTCFAIAPDSDPNSSVNPWP